MAWPLILCSSTCPPNPSKNLRIRSPQSLTSRMGQTDVQNANGTQQDQLLRRDCWAVFLTIQRKNPKYRKSKRKRAEKVLLFFRATHASTLQSLACVSISEVNSIFFRWKRLKKKKKNLRIQPSENCFGHSHAISRRSKEEKNQLLLIYLFIHSSTSFLSNVKKDVLCNFTNC